MKKQKVNDEPIGAFKVECRNCRSYDLKVKSRMMPSMLDDFTLTAKYPCRRFPATVWKSFDEWCDEYKQKGS